jgi:hypothetical protein
VNNAGCRHDDPRAALFDPFNVACMATLNAHPEAPKIVCSIRQRLGTLRQYRQWEMVIAAPWRIAFRDLKRAFAAAVEYR